MRIFVEADSIVAEKMSGIGHTTLEIIRALDAQAQQSNLSLTVIVPFGKKNRISQYGFKATKVRQLPPGYRYVNYALTRISLPTYADLLFGKGVYIFPNYKTWPLLFSKAITFIHDVSFRIFPETTQPQNLPYLLKNIPRWIKRTDKIISISHQSASEIASFYPEAKDKTETIYLGIDEKVYYRRNDAEIDVAKNEYGITGSYVLAVGNIEPRKNIDILLDAFKSHADATKSQMSLVLIGGSGWNNEGTLNKIQALIDLGYHVVRPAKYVLDEDLPALYSGASALVQIALHEGFGLSPVQALACGTPMLLSDIPVFKEVIGERKGALYVPTDDVVAIENALAEIDKVNLENPAPSHDLTWSLTAERLAAIAGIIAEMKMPRSTRKTPKNRAL